MKNKLVNNKIYNLIFNGDKRSVKIKKNMLMSTIFKAATILLGFLIVNVTYNSLNDEKFGVWMTILSILTWISMFDVGLGNGLRNKLSEALSKEDYKKSKIYVSTAYALIGILVVIMMIASVVLIEASNLSSVFNVKESLGVEIKYSLLWIVILYLINFLLSLINSIAFAFQDSAVPEMIRFFTNLIIFIAFYIVSKAAQGNLFIIGFLYSLITLLVTLIFSIYLFNKKYRRVVPNIKNLEMKYVKSLFSLSMGFFIIQIAGIVIFTTGNMVITQVLGPQEVTPYQLVYKLFNIFTIASGLVVAPLWSGFTDAYFKKDLVWIKSAMKKMLILMVPLTLGVILMIFLCRPIIKIWIGKDLGASTLLIVLMGINAIQITWNSIFTVFVNGIGRIRAQIYTSIIGGIINIPLSIYFARNLGLGSSGVILGTICSLMLGTIILPIQTYGILKKELKA
jgi:O-antigen/teichoic acid export membrane protein